MSEQLHEHQSYHRRIDDNIDEIHPHLRHDMAIKSLEKRTDDLECFRDAHQPSLAYLDSVIKRNEERAEFFKKTAYNIAGWGIMGILTFVGGVFITVIWPALIIKFKQYLSGF
jgi:hypothetical protein